MKDNTRLNANIRSVIRDGIVKHRFGPELKGLIKEFRSIAQSTYEATFSIEQLELMAKLPKGWLEEQNGISLIVGANSHFLRFSGMIYCHHSLNSLRYYANTYLEHLPGDERPMPNGHQTFKVSQGSELGVRMNKALNLQSGIEEAYPRALGQINTVLTSYGTVGNLKKAWPECEPFVPKSEPSSAVVTSVPAVSVPALNQMLGLPV